LAFTDGHESGDAMAELIADGVDIEAGAYDFKEQPAALSGETFQEAINVLR